MHPGRGKAEGRVISEDPTEHEISERHQDANNEDSIMEHTS